MICSGCGEEITDIRHTVIIDGEALCLPTIIADYGSLQDFLDYWYPEESVPVKTKEVAVIYRITQTYDNAPNLEVVRVVEKNAVGEFIKTGRDRYGIEDLCWAVATMEVEE